MCSNLSLWFFSTFHWWFLIKLNPCHIFIVHLDFLFCEIHSCSDLLSIFYWIGFSLHSLWRIASWDFNFFMVEVSVRLSTLGRLWILISVPDTCLGHLNKKSSFLIGLWPQRFLFSLSLELGDHLLSCSLFKKSFSNLLQYCFCFYVCLFGCFCGILGSPN